jgi:hypothetical protein
MLSSPLCRLSLVAVLSLMGVKSGREFVGSADGNNLVAKDGL